MPKPDATRTGWTVRYDVGDWLKEDGTRGAAVTGAHQWPTLRAAEIVANHLGDSCFCIATFSRAYFARLIAREKRAAAAIALEIARAQGARAARDGSVVKLTLPNHAPHPWDEPRCIDAARDLWSVRTSDGLVIAPIYGTGNARLVAAAATLFLLAKHAADMDLSPRTLQARARNVIRKVRP